MKQLLQAKGRLSASSLRVEVVQYRLVSTLLFPSGPIRTNKSGERAIMHTPRCTTLGTQPQGWSQAAYPLPYLQLTIGCGS